MNAAQHGFQPMPQRDAADEGVRRQTTCNRHILGEIPPMSISFLIDQYCQVWTEPSAARRTELLSAIWAKDATYTDPTVHTQGAAQLLAHIVKVQSRRPGAKVMRTSQIDFHHNYARFAWHVVNADGTTLPEGLDLAFFTADGAKIQQIIGFFGPLKRENE